MPFVLLREGITPRIPLFQPNSLVTVYCFIYAKVFLFFQVASTLFIFQRLGRPIRRPSYIDLVFAIIVVLALLVRWRLGSPVIFRQKRPGFCGRPFWLLKFRTMTNIRDVDGTLLPDALRLSPFGCWLRTTSLDELPD